MDNVLLAAVSVELLAIGGLLLMLRLGSAANHHHLLTFGFQALAEVGERPHRLGKFHAMAFPPEPDQFISIGRVQFRRLKGVLDGFVRFGQLAAVLPVSAQAGPGPTQEA